jgi:predicted nucleic-acid-binding Zn-ribbon protein
MSGLPPPKVGRLATEVRIHSAMEELKKRGVEKDYCIRCNTDDWNVDLLEIPASSSMTRAGFAKSRYTQIADSLSVLAIVCRNCGYTMFHNLEILGISTR